MDAARSQLYMFKNELSGRLPESFLINHLVSTFVETVRWWADNGLKESAETVAEYFRLAAGIVFENNA